MNRADLSNDGDPKFLAEFYKNLKILSQDLYKKSALSQHVPGNSSSGGGKVPLLKNKSINNKGSKDYMSLALGADDELGPPSGINNNDSFIGSSSSTGAQAHPADYFSHDNIHERLKLYAAQGGLPKEYFERYALSKKMKDEE